MLKLMSETSADPAAGEDEAPPMSHGDLLAEARRDLRESESELYKLQRRVGGLRKLIEGLEWLEAHRNPKETTP